MVAEEGEGFVDGGGSCWALGVVGRSLKIVGHVGGAGESALEVEHHASLGFVLAVGRGQSSGRGGSDACRLVRQSTSCIQDFSWRASRIQLLREPKSSIVTSGTLANRRRRFLMM